LGQDRERAPIHDIGQGTGGNREEKHRQTVDGLEKSHQQRRLAERGHQPRLADFMHPRAYVGDQPGDP